MLGILSQFMVLVGTYDSVALLGAAKSSLYSGQCAELYRVDLATRCVIFMLRNIWFVQNINQPMYHLFKVISYRFLLYWHCV